MENWIKGLNKCGFLIILAFLYGFLVYYGILCNKIVDIVCGSFLLGCVVTVIMQEVVEYVLDKEDEKDLIK